jgi:DMSO/TMAO reductase YedYZ molybdopterin-dependent catalytic subunit
MSDEEVHSPAREPRLPPGQVETRGWPVLHYGSVPKIDLASWNLRIFGLVDAPRSWTWEELAPLPRRRVHCDIHCVTHWSKFGNVFEGIPVAALFDEVKPQPAAKFAIVHAEAGFTTNLPMEELLREDVILATHHNGEPLTPDHGWPMRLVVPHLYFWKSAKWMRGLELTERNRPGFWERNGYHMRGDPWAEERYSF